MYGKFFSSAFTGSMVGAGADVFAVWGYVIAHAVDSLVEINPIVAGAQIGMTAAEVTTAIEQLCKADPNSRNKSEGGSRLFKSGAFSYQVVSHSLYRNMRNEAERRDYNRVKKQESRARAACQTRSNTKSKMSAHTEAEAEAEAEAETETEAGNVTGLAANKPKPKTPSKRSSTSSAQVLEIFEHWKSSVNATGAKLDSTRKRIITSALKMYSVDDLKLAATGISKSDFNMGRDPKAPGKRNCGINLVYRDAEHIEKYKAMAASGGASNGARRQATAEQREAALESRRELAASIEKARIKDELDHAALKARTQS